LHEKVNLFLVAHSTEDLQEAALVVFQENGAVAYLGSYHFGYLDSSYANATASRVNEYSLGKLSASMISLQSACDLPGL